MLAFTRQHGLKDMLSVRIIGSPETMVSNHLSEAKWQS
jgi:hypothetical protein